MGKQCFKGLLDTYSVWMIRYFGLSFPQKKEEEVFGEKDLKPSKDPPFMSRMEERITSSRDGRSNC